MSLTKGQEIKKITANNIIGVINDFNTNVVDNAFNKRNYNSSTYPSFTGSATYGRTGSSATTGWTNPRAIPSGQLAADNKTSMTSISDTIITASTLWSSMLSITRQLVKIRKFTSYWYHKTDATNNLVNSITGYGVFNTAYPSVPTGTLSNNVKGETWTRSGSTSITLNPTQTINSNEIATAISINDAINNCYNSWVDNCYNGNVLTYNFYTCHQNCHSNWADARGRR